MYKQNIRMSITATMFALALSGCAATGGLGGAGSTGGTDSTGAAQPQVFSKYFARTTKFGNYDVNNPRLAEGAADGEYAVVEKHGSLTLDIGADLTYYDGSGSDLFVQTSPERDANYTVHVQYAGQDEDDWTEIGRGYGSDEFDFENHKPGYADFVQIRNEGREPLYLDAVKARYVRRD